MGKHITLTDKNSGKVYTLEYNRKAIETMERQGFISSELADKPATMLPLLLRGAFLMHHPTVRREVAESLLDEIHNKTALIEKLVEMYNEPILSLIGDGEGEEDMGNVEWGASF